MSCERHLLQEAFAWLSDKTPKSMIDDIRACLAAPASFETDLRRIAEKEGPQAQEFAERVLATAPASAEPCIWYESVVSGLKYGNPSAAGDISAVIVLGKRYVAAPSPAPAEPVAWLTKDGKEACSAGDKEAWLQQDEMRSIAEEHCVPCYAAPSPAPAEPVAHAAEMPGSNGGFTMAAFRAADVPVGTAIYAGAAPTPEVEQRVLSIPMMCDKHKSIPQTFVCNAVPVTTYCPECERLAGGEK
jgi:hypothetical protein